MLYQSIHTEGVEQEKLATARRMFARGADLNLV
jgi:hypothetical protein